MIHNHPVSYEEPFYRPPAEAGSVLLQLTIGCSHNRCTYCAMYRKKAYRVRAPEAVAHDCRNLAEAYQRANIAPRKVFIGDGDALAAPTKDIIELLKTIKTLWPSVHRIATYLTAANVLEKSAAELSELAALGLRLGYLGMESGSDAVLRQIVKGNTADDMLKAAEKLDRTGWQLSIIGMLGVGGRRLSQEHSRETARVITQIAPRYFSLLTTIVIPGTPFERATKQGQIEVLSIRETLAECRAMLADIGLADIGLADTGLADMGLAEVGAPHRRIIFRANHASNLLPLEGILPRDTRDLLSLLDEQIRRCPEGLYQNMDPAFL